MVLSVGLEKINESDVEITIADYTDQYLLRVSRFCNYDLEKSLDGCISIGQRLTVCYFLL